MSSPLLIIAFITCFLVLLVLVLGIGSFAKGGQFGRKYSNKLMRIRIILQAIAVVLIVTFVFFNEKG
ncbi:MAG: twin transmembrane helix small protein [Rhodobacteraceae bacterium]|nr:MAG: twin transmembrane helix small protein [Paracoccaceae bacterium]